MIIIRNPKRIDMFTEELNRIWKTYFCDLRYCQFMSNFLNWIYSRKNIDPFFVEETECLQYLKEYCGEKK